MRSNRITFIVMAIVLVAFVLIKVMPMFKTHTFPKAGKVQVKPKINSFENEGVAWFVTSTGDTLSKINIEIAESSSEISKGLMNRKSLAVDHGMLFIFSESDYRSFWMKNTLISLDIIYLRQDGSIDSYYRRTTPKSVESLPSGGEVMYVLEVIGGYMSRNGIGNDSRLIFEKH